MPESGLCGEKFLSGVIGWGIVGCGDFGWFRLNFDEKKFFTDLEASTTKQIIDKEIQVATEELEIDATPTMIINNEKYVGLKPYTKIKEILESHGAKRK